MKIKMLPVIMLMFGLNATATLAQSEDYEESVHKVVRIYFAVDQLDADFAELEEQCGGVEAASALVRQAKAQLADAKNLSKEALQKFDQKDQFSFAQVSIKSRLVFTKATLTRVSSNLQREGELTAERMELVIKLVNKINALMGSPAVAQ